MKKILSIMLALILVLSMATVAFATETDTGAAVVPTDKTNQEASFKKTYEITNEGTSNPEETFTFKFTADHVTDSNANLTTAQMPAIADSAVTFAAGTATVAGLEKAVDVALSNVQWPGVGVYYYTVNETPGTTAGVTYDNTTAWLKVTVAYSESTDTYYTAFVTLSLADENPKDGQTDVKTKGFTNEYSAGSLSISKEVTGNMGNKKAYFAVKVTLTGETGKTYQETYAVSGGSYESNPTTIKIGAETTFYLKHDETITIGNLPYGVTYTVVEEDYTTEAKGGYDAASYDDNQNGTIRAASVATTITNNKGVAVDTGITLDSLPYILMLVVVCGAMFVLFTKKRAAREN